MKHSFSVPVLSLCTLAAIQLCAADAPGTKPPKVMAATPVTVYENAPRRYAGEVEAIEHVQIIARITGNIEKIHFTEGEIVQAGDLLYEIEDTTYQAVVDQLKAEKEVLDAALRYAEVEFDRSEKLLATNAVSVSNHDRALLEIQSAQARIKQIEASLTDAENNLSYTRIHAPITGRIGKSAFSAGNLVSAASGPLTDIESAAPVYVRFNISENIFRRDFGGLKGIKDTAKVTLTLADGSVYPETAAVTLVNNKINKTTNTVTLWAAFANTDHELLPGSFVNVHVAAASAKGFPAISPSALQSSEKGYFVYILGPDNIPEVRPVTAGDTVNGMLVITSGLDGSETVITGGTNKIIPGTPVEPVSGTAE